MHKNEHHESHVAESMRLSEQAARLADHPPRTEAQHASDEPQRPVADDGPPRLFADATEKELTDYAVRTGKTVEQARVELAELRRVIAPTKR